MDQVPQVKCCDPRIPDGAEGAPGRVEQEVAAHRELPGEGRVRTAGVFGNQDVGVEQVPVDQVAPLGAGVDKAADASFTSPEDPVEVALRAEGCSPAVNRLRRVVSQAVTEPGSPGQAATGWPPAPADRHAPTLPATAIRA